MIDWKIEQLIRGKYQRGELEGQIPDHWNEDEVVDYFATYGVSYIMSKGEAGDKVPEWATKLARALDQVEKLILPAVERMNREKREQAQQEARFYRSLYTDEEQKLSRPAYPPDKTREEEEPKSTKDFGQMAEEALADEELQRELTEEGKKPKAYPNPPKSKPKEWVGQFPDYTKQNMEKDPQTLARIGLARATMSSLNEEERKEVVREFVKSRSKDLTFQSGARQVKEKMPAEGGKSPPVQMRNEDLKRRMFGKLTDAVKGENESNTLLEEAEALPEKICNIVERLSEKPFHKWTPEELSSAQKYFSPEDIRLIIERGKTKISESRNRST